VVVGQSFRKGHLKLFVYYLQIYVRRAPASRTRLPNPALRSSFIRGVITFDGKIQGVGDLGIRVQSGVPQVFECQG
jgi:hypothetical protein